MGWNWSSRLIGRPWSAGDPPTQPNVALACVVLFLVGCTSTPVPSPTSSASTPASPVATAAPSADLHEPSVFPAEVLGLRVHSIGDAKALVAADKVNGRLIAISGYWSSFAIPCPAMPHEAVMSGFCTGVHFSDSNEVPTPGMGDPNAPVLVPETGNPDAILFGGSFSNPSAVVLIAHAYDSRAWQCAPDDLENCRLRLAVDRVAWSNGTLTSLAPLNDQVAPRLSMSDLTAVTAKSEQLVTAYPLQSTQLNDVDPRLLGWSTGVVWYLRLAKTPADPDGISDGVVRLVSDATSSVVGELSLASAADYQPARLVLDSHGGADTSERYPHFSVKSDGTILGDDTLDLGTTPIALEAGSYVLHGFLQNNDGSPADGPTCDLPITITAESNVSYRAEFTKTACQWAPAVSQF